MRHFTPYQSKLLRSLATYQYLTVSQMLRLKIGKSRSNIRDSTLKNLKNIRPALIQFQDFGSIAGIGRLEQLFYLTPKGAETVAEDVRCDVSEIIYPRFGIRFKNDYFHRKMFVDFHISLRYWINQDDKRDLFFFNSYYTKTKGQRPRSINMFRFKPSPHLPPHHRKTIEPDGVFIFSKGKNPILCTMELHRSPNSNDITKQLAFHMTAINQNLIKEQFSHPTDNLVLSVHEHRSSLESVKKRLLAMPEFQPFLPVFHFNLSKQINKQFHENWTTADGQPSRLFL